MIIRKIDLGFKLAVLGLALFGLTNSLTAAEPTALSLIKEGNRYVGEDVKDQVVQIRSDKSVGGLTPNIWYVVYYDADAPLKATEVKFGAGKKMEVNRPMRLLEPMTGADKKLDRKRMNIDSDKALTTATAEPLLEKLKLTAVQMWLQHGDDGVPTWKVRLWAAKMKNPNNDANVGDVYISADDGKVLRSDLHIDRVN